MGAFEADPTQDGTLPLCFCHTSRLSLLPLVFRRALNWRAAFYSGISRVGTEAFRVDQLVLGY